MSDLAEYVKYKSLEYGKVVNSNTIIYLDTNFWIDIQRNTDVCLELRQILFELSEQNFLFPISEFSFYEFLNQKDNHSFMETINLVDYLSKGYSFVSSKKIRALELQSYFYKLLGLESYDPIDLIWSRVGLIPTIEIMPDLKNFDFEKRYYDFITNISLTEIVNVCIGKKSLLPISFKEPIEELNKKKMEYIDEHKSIESLFMAELGGYIDLYRNDIFEAVKNALNHISSGNIYVDEEELQKYYNLIYHGFRLKKINNELPSLSITPEIFTSVRWDKKRKYKEKDHLTIDSYHATVALPYCDYFFTEKDLHSTIVKQKLDKKYNCCVESKKENVIRILKEIKCL